MKRVLRSSIVVGLFTLVAVFLMARSGEAQLGGVPSWIGQLVLGNGDMFFARYFGGTQEELPGLGHKFELLFAMNDDHDPLNLTNDVISVVTTTVYPAGIGVAFRNTPPASKSRRSPISFS